MAIAPQLEIKPRRPALGKNPNRFPGQYEVADMYIDAPEPGQCQMVTARYFQDQDLSEFLVTAGKHNFAIRRRDSFSFSRGFEP